ncbi:LysR substrate-binding domain-containing protein [Tritonibacter mobilis]|uniref:LysR substrate-binding domain-containing protein n=1 Tax=Tritonibacter mobilis TaxID=379347 RepID=UPI003990175C
MLYDFGIPSDFVITPLMAAEPYALLPRGHKLAQQPSVRAEDLAQEPVILMNLPRSRGYFLSLLQNTSVPVRVAHETGSIEMLRSMVANGFGVGLLATDLPDGPCYDGSPVIRVPLIGRPPQHQVALGRGRHWCADGTNTGSRAWLPQVKGLSMARASAIEQMHQVKVDNIITRWLCITHNRGAMCVANIARSNLPISLRSDPPGAL